MLIRTQDRKTLVNTDRLTLITASEAKDTIGVFVTDDVDFGGGFLIGKYSTMEKSEKVLDMIEEAYKKDKHFLPVTVAAGATNITQFALIEPQVFQMPQDEEVPDV